MKAIISNSLLPKLKPNETPYDVWDTKLPGFHLRIYPNGKMVYRCAYMRGRVFTIGKSELITSAQARDKARHVLGEAAVGIYPNSKKMQANKILTFYQYIETEYGPWRIANRKHGKGDIERIKVHFFNEFGEKQLSAITPFALEKWRLNRLNAKIKPATINRDINNLKASLAKAEEWEIIDQNPLIKFKATKLIKPEKSDI